MALTWKDLITTIMAALVLGMYFAMSKGLELPLITGYRGGVLVLAILGIGMCAFSNANGGSWTSPFIAVASVLGIVALGLIIYGLITGTKLAFALLAITLLVLWGVATLRHVLG